MKAVVTKFSSTDSSGSKHRQMASEAERELSRQGKPVPERPTNIPEYSIGCYDENRLGMYESDLFENTENHIDGFRGRRSVHIGIDLAGPVGTPIYSFCDGNIHAVGYNSKLGDYGNVIVIRHELASPSDNSEESRIIYALYGHLNGESIRSKAVGNRVKAGDQVGALGDIHENGGWFVPHVHFQLSIHAPATHDMPGVVSLEDRPKALLEYPDPRYVLGKIY